MSACFEDLSKSIFSCRICRETPTGKPLPHEPRPVFRGRPHAPIMLAGQAPGTKVHLSGKPYTDPSGVRLRAWLGLDEPAFYDEETVAIVPMGFCFPGQDAKGGDLPPRPECAVNWHDRLMACYTRVRLLVLIGQYAQRYHFRRLGLEHHLGASLRETVAKWHEIYGASQTPRILPIPHPSWRNTAWLKKNPWFESELLPVLRREVRQAQAQQGAFPAA